MLEKLEEKYFKLVDFPYYEFEKKINNEVFRKYLIIDIRKMPDEKINSIFSDFSSFNCQLLENYFFSLEIKKENFDYRKNMIVLFVYSPDRKYQIDKHEALYNMEYAFKKFVTEEELADIVSKSSIEIDYSKIIFYSNNGFSLLPGFNLIYGSNGSGKSRLLFDFYNNLKNVPVYNMDDWGLDLVGRDRIKDYSLVEMYLNKLNEFNRYREDTPIETYLYRLSQILAYSKEQNNIVLLDDLCWGSLDDRNLINVLDTLFEYSCDNAPVVVTSCQNNIKKLVRSRVYNPNIIEVNYNK